MKKTIKILIITLMMTFTFFGLNMKKVDAASGTFSISAPSSVTAGNTFSVTFKATGSKIFYWQFYVSYSSTKLKLVSGSTTIQGEADDINSGVSTITKTLTFKALSTGSATVSIARGDADMNIDTSSNSISFTTAKKTIEIVPVVPKSTNNNLASLGIDGVTLDPAFSADVTSYNAEIAANTTEVNVTAAAADAKASIAGIGKVAVVEGANTINVVVTAENGSTKTYIINATVKELTPVEVKIGKDTYTVIRKKGVYEPPKNFEETTIRMGEESVLAYTNKKINCTILGLKNAKGDIALYAYDAKAKTYTKYNEIVVDDTNIYLKTLPNGVKVPVGYDSTALKIGEVTFDAWQYNNDDNYYLVYGINTATGDETFYSYDKERASIQRLNVNQIADMQNQSQQMLLYAMIAAGVAVVFAVISTILLFRGRKGKKKSKSKSKIDLSQDIYLEKELEMKEEEKNK
jgi:hypothetical protein